MIEKALIRMLKDEFGEETCVSISKELWSHGKIKGWEIVFSLSVSGKDVEILQSFKTFDGLKEYVYTLCSFADKTETDSPITVNDILAHDSLALANDMFNQIAMLNRIRGSN